MKLIDKILEDFSILSDVNSSEVDDFQNELHIIRLKEVMTSHGVPEEVINPIINTITEQDGEGGLDDDEKEKAKKMGLTHLGRGSYGKQGKSPTHKAQDGKLVKVDTSKETEKETKPPIKIDPNPYDKKDKDKEVKTKMGKDKTLRDDASPIDDFNNKDEFTKTGISDQQFENNPNVEKNSDKDFTLTEEQQKNIFGETSKFPPRYFKTLSRIMSMSRTKKGSITDVVKGVGAGEFGAQSGEILTMMGATIVDDEKSKLFFDLLRDHEKGTKKPVLTKSWIDSAEKVRKGMFKRYDSQYGKGNWEITSAAWDVENEVESLGMKNYKNDKGFSTDAYFVINGEDMDEVSLKKDLKANLLNATTGRVLDLIIQGNAKGDELENYNNIISKATTTGKLKLSVLSDDEKQQLSDIQDKYKSDEYGWSDNVDAVEAKKRQQNLQNELMRGNSLKDDIEGDRDLTDEEKLKIGQSMAIAKKDRDSVIDVINNDIPKILDRLKQPSSRDDLKRVMKELGMKTNSRNLGKITVIMGRIANVKNSDSNTGKNLTSLINNSKGHSQAVSEAIIKSPELRKGLLRSIRDALPLKSLFEGEEKMHLGEQTLDTEILKKLFNVDNFDQLSQSLTLVDDAIVYQAKVVDEETGIQGIENIPIAAMKNRPDGIAYGETWKLEFKVHPEFGTKVKQTNEELGRI